MLALPLLCSVVKCKVPPSVDSAMLRVGSRFSCSFKIIRSVQLHGVPSDLICLDVQIEKQKLEGKELFLVLTAVVESTITQAVVKNRSQLLVLVSLIATHTSILD